ncbi:MAG: ComEA family DNA-binding protein [Ruminococcaceae bacterium]|nr:ComEA family DNA-binding protein [Oscillospiraceae bacterium]
MKLLKSEKAALLITVLFLVLALGFALGGRSRDTSVVETEFAVKSSGDIYLQEISSTGKMPNAATALININTCTKEQLESLPGIGPILAERIIEFRRQNGGFKTIEDITKVQGIGASVYEDIYRMICTQ